MLYGTLLATLGTSGTSGTSRSGPFRTSTTRFGVPTTERIGRVPGTGFLPADRFDPRSTVAPSGLIPLELCPQANLAIRNLLEPRDLDNGILTDAARTLHGDLPASYGDDIDTLFADALTRVGRDRTGTRTGEAAAAGDRLASVVDEACPAG